MPEPDREHPEVVKAKAVGAVACPKCMLVHIDLLDENQGIFATASLTFEQWLQMSTEVVDEIEALTGKDH